MSNCNNTFPEYVVFNPGDEVSEEHRAWQGCPTIARTRGGRLFAGWYTGGAFEPCINNYNLLVQSDDDGKNWSKPILAVYSDHKARNRNIDIQLWVDNKNRLWAMWTRSPYYEDSKPATIRTRFDFGYHREFIEVEALICNDPDADELIWEKPRVICGGFLRNKPIIRKNGDYLFPAYDWINKDNYVIRISKDEGESFTDLLAAPKPANEVFDETMAFECGDRLCLMTRTNLGCYLSFYTDDDGKTWSEPVEYQKAPSTRFYIARLSSGQLIYARSVSDTVRQGVKVCISEDDGKSWPYELVLETRHSVSYPDLTEGVDGQLYLVYDRERDNRIHLDSETWTSKAAKEILFAKFTVQDVYNGFLGEGSFSAQIISKGAMDFVEI